MNKNIKISIILSFFCLWLNSYFNHFFEDFIGFFFIFSIGILHGANDLVLIKKINISKNSYSFVKILTYYVIIVLLAVLLFYLIPLFTLFFFIIVSGYHFGEQQLLYLNDLSNKSIIYLASIVYGLFILFLLFCCHQQEVVNIIFEISQVNIPKQLFSIVLKILSIALFSIFLYLYIYQKNIKEKILLEVFYIGVFLVIFLSSGLIWGFAIYFIIWHSVPSMIDQIKFLYVDVNSKNLIQYIKTAFWYWIVSLFGIFFLYYLFKDQKIFNALFFSFLAAITFPHVLVIIKMFEKNK